MPQPVLAAHSRAVPPVWLLFVAIFVGGMLGGGIRYLVGLVLVAEPGRVPWGIVLVNLSGAYLISLLLAGWSRRGHPAHPWRPFLATGLLGSFTTWSSFMADSLEMLQAGRILLGSAFIVGHVAAGVVAAAAGWWTASRLVPEAGLGGHL